MSHSLRSETDRDNLFLFTNESPLGVSMIIQQIDVSAKRLNKCQWQSFIDIESVGQNF